MFSRAMLRSSTVNASRGNGAALALKARASTPLAANPCRTPFIHSLEARRYISVYGYTQSKALVYSKYGEPKDVLRYVIYDSAGLP